MLVTLPVLSPLMEEVKAALVTPPRGEPRGWLVADDRLAETPEVIVRRSIDLRRRAVRRDLTPAELELDARLRCEREDEPDAWTVPGSVARLLRVRDVSWTVSRSAKVTPPRLITPESRFGEAQAELLSGLGVARPATVEAKVFGSPRTAAVAVATAIGGRMVRAVELSRGKSPLRLVVVAEVGGGLVQVHDGRPGGEPLLLGNPEVRKHVSKGVVAVA